MSYNVVAVGPLEEAQRTSQRSLSLVTNLNNNFVIHFLNKSQIQKSINRSFPYLLLAIQHTRVGAWAEERLLPSNGAMHSRSSVLFLSTSPVLSPPPHDESGGWFVGADSCPAQ